MPAKPASSRGKALKGKVSVVIPVEPGGSVEAALKALKALPKAEKGLICEVLVAEGRNPSRQRNLAVAQAKGEFIHFLDSDSRLEPGSLPLLLDAAKPKLVAVVGGPNVAPDDETPVGLAFDKVLGSWLGSFTSAARYRPVGDRRDCSEKELILCNLFFKRDSYLTLGGLREDLYPNEENELFNRAMRQGLHLVYEPRAQVQRPRRQTMLDFTYQAFRYGRGRAQQMRISFHTSDLVNLAPLGLLFCFLVVLFPPWIYLGGFMIFLRLGGLLGVLLFMWAASVSAFWTERNVSDYRFVLAPYYTFVGYHFRHLAYAMGLLAGLFQRPHARPVEVKLGRQRL